MKRLALISTLLFFGSTAFAQVHSIIVDEVNHEGVIGDFDFTGYTTYKLYALLENPTDRVFSILGESLDEFAPISVTTSTSFYQNEYGGVLGKHTNPILLNIPGLEALAFDSYLTIGASSSYTAGVQSTVDPSGAIEYSTSPLTVHLETGDNWISNFEAGGDITITTGVAGGIFTFLEDEYSQPHGTNNAVFIGQFTTDGEFDFCLNIQTVSNYPNNTPEDLFVLFDLCYTHGCNDIEACNYNQAANSDDGSCYFFSDDCELPEEEDGVINSECNCVQVRPGDYDRDAAYTSVDLAGILSEYGGSQNLVGDFNEDFTITTEDLTAFLAVFGSTY